MNKAVEKMSDYLYNLRRDMKENDYIELMNQLGDINKYTPKQYKYHHRIEYEMITQICYIDDDEEFLKQKKENYYDSYEQYQESDEPFDEDYERMKEVKTEGRFFCYTSEIIGENTHNPFEVLRLIGESKKHTLDYYCNPMVLEEHQRDVQQYYNRYLREWDDWVRIIVESPIKIVSISYIQETDDI